jgi:hypothetical protein
MMDKQQSANKRVNGDTLEGDLLWRCRKCSAVYTEMPIKRRCQVESCGGRVAPFKPKPHKGEVSLGTQTERISQGAKDLSFLPMIQKVLGAADALNYAALKAEDLVEKLRKRNLAAGEEYVDSADFDLSLYNMRAWLVLDMLTLKGMLQAVGLESYVKPALLRLLDLRLRPITEGTKVSVTMPPQLERRLTKIEEAVTAKSPEVPQSRRKKPTKLRG